MLSLKMLRLSKDESQNPMNCGYGFAMEQKNRWEDLDINDPPEELFGYNVATTFIVKDGIVYTIFKDFIFPDEKFRLYILKERDLETDRKASSNSPSPDENGDDTPNPE